MLAIFPIRTVLPVKEHPMVCNGENSYRRWKLTSNKLQKRLAYWRILYVETTGALLYHVDYVFRKRQFQLKLLQQPIAAMGNYYRNDPLEGYNSHVKKEESLNSIRNNSGATTTTTLKNSILFCSRQKLIHCRQKILIGSVLPARQKPRVQSAKTRWCAILHPKSPEHHHKNNSGEGNLRYV